jgi:hypothetical protein
MRTSALLQLHPPAWLHWPDWLPTTRSQFSAASAVTEQPDSQWHYRAWHYACRRLAHHHPEWVGRRFDEAFLRSFVSSPTVPGASELALAWDHRFGPMTSRPAHNSWPSSPKSPVSFWLSTLAFYYSERHRRIDTSAGHTDGTR